MVSRFFLDLLDRLKLPKWGWSNYCEDPNRGHFSCQLSTLHTKHVVRTENPFRNRTKQESNYSSISDASIFYKRNEKLGYKFNRRVGSFNTF